MPYLPLPEELGSYAFLVSENNKQTEKQTYCLWGLDRKVSLSRDQV